jgi:hypothetical protein
MRRARRASGRKNGRRQPTEEAPWQTAAVVEHNARSDGLAISEHFKTYSTGVNEARYAFASAVIARSEATKQSSFCDAARWIASLRSQRR